jgi:glycine C-acetyltransferase
MQRALVKLSQTHGALGEQIKRVLDEAKQIGTFKSERIIQSAQSSAVALAGSGSLLNLCANNYLGLSNNPHLVEAAKKTLDTHGFGMSSVRFICGTQDLHKTLEERIAKFHGMEDAILYGSCFDANTGFFEALLGEGDAIFSDELNHASIIDGVRLCKAKTKYRYKHLDYVDLEKKLDEVVSASENPNQIRLIVTDGVFSMDGDLARLDKLKKLTEKFPNTYLLVDECHGTGVLGKTGRGTPEVFGVQPDLINSTLGKALGGATGGYTVGKKDVIEMLRQKSRPYLFSNSVAPAIVGATIEVLNMVEQHGEELVGKLHANTKYFRDAMHHAGFTVLGNDECPIVPVFLGDAVISGTLAEELLTRGIYVVSFSYPVVAKNQARIRVQISAAHTKQQLSKAVAAFVSVGKELGVLDRFTSIAFDQHTATGKARAQGHVEGDDEANLLKP